MYKAVVSKNAAGIKKKKLIEEGLYSHFWI